VASSLVLDSYIFGQVVIIYFRVKIIYRFLLGIEPYSSTRPKDSLHRNIKRDVNDKVKVVPVL